MQRTGGTDLQFENNVATLSANIGLTDAKAGYSASAEFQGISISASADASISKVNVYFDATFQKVGEDCQVSMGRFDITEIGNIDVHVHGLGPLDWILGTLAGFIADLIKGFLGDVIEGPVKDLIQNELGKIDVPFCF